MITQPETETLLVVDDEASVREFVRRVLVNRGYQVAVAETADEALAHLKNDKMHVPLLITDFMMPEMSGHDLAERVKASHPDIGVLFISGYTQEAVRELGRMDPDAYLLEKPFTAHALIQAVHNLLEVSEAMPDRI